MFTLLIFDSKKILKKKTIGMKIYLGKEGKWNELHSSEKFFQKWNTELNTL